MACGAAAASWPRSVWSAAEICVRKATADLGTAGVVCGISRQGAVEYSGVGSATLATHAALAAPPDGVAAIN